VFPVAATEAVVARPLSERVSYDDEPPMRLAGARALELARTDAGALDLVDLYSCFPSAVQLGARAVGLSEERPLTLTGGLTFAGGPFNSYVLHAIATLMLRLRERPGARGLVSSVGGLFSKHAYGVYASAPPERPFAFEDVAERVRRLPARALDAAYIGEARVESYTVAHERGRAPRAIVALRTPDARRTWARSEDERLLTRLREEDLCERPARVAGDRSLAL
jgi:acetyl-CoA C-acetyltransferase